MDWERFKSPEVKRSTPFLYIDSPFKEIPTGTTYITILDTFYHAFDMTRHDINRNTGIRISWVPYFGYRLCSVVLIDLINWSVEVNTGIKSQNFLH